MYIDIKQYYTYISIMVYFISARSLCLVKSHVYNSIYLGRKYNKPSLDRLLRKLVITLKFPT